MGEHAAIMAYRHHAGSTGMLLRSFFNQDLALTTSFAFTALAVYLLARDYDGVRRYTLKIEQRRMNLSRFFSPTVVNDLQEASATLDLERRKASVMFVDIRHFTSYAEVATAQELAGVLAEYRRIVAGTVFAHGGTVDKFIGDGVMAVFGQPRPRTDDANRALACALELAATLDQWRAANLENGNPSLKSAIGLHCGTVTGGIIESGFHDEFTVIGDAVNVAQRLETLAKSLKTPLVVSEALMQELPVDVEDDRWVRRKAVRLPGRRQTIEVAWIRRPATDPLEMPVRNETGERA